MTRQERRRAILDLGKWELEREDLSTADKPLFKWSPRYVEPDPRLEKATEQKARKLFAVRCKRCGRSLGVVLDPAEGLLFVAYMETEGEFKAIGSFVDELEGDVDLRCRRCGKKSVVATDIKTRAETRDPDDIFV